VKKEDPDAEEGDVIEATLDAIALAEMGILEDVGAIEDERLGMVSSNELIKVDDDGDPMTFREKMVFVDEVKCIGCNLCSQIAPSTFMMEDDHGRARCFNQEAEDEETIAEAISVCPVSCIHYVPWEELVRLEKKREVVMQNYNFKGRFASEDGFLDSNGAHAALFDLPNGPRCLNCPSSECLECPMFGVSKDPGRIYSCGRCPENGCANCPVFAKSHELECQSANRARCAPFQQQRTRRDRKRRQFIKARKQDAVVALGAATLKRTASF